MNSEFRSGFVPIVGRPNVGKSTLINRLMGQKVAIVSPKPQTTRNRISGILTEDNCQIIFLDTPGIMAHPHYRLQRQMVETAIKTLEEADVIILMVEATSPPTPEDQQILHLVTGTKTPSILAMNKSDKVKGKENILPIMEEYLLKHQFLALIPISSLTGDGLDDLLKTVRESLPVGPEYYPEDMATDMPQRFIAGEIVREKIFLKTQQEVPYATAVRVEEFKERDGCVHIQAIIYVERNSQKGIVIGQGGQMLKEIGSAARRELESYLGTKVHLELWVKVREKWRRKDNDLRFFGYVTGRGGYV